MKRPAFILASVSPRRRELLEALGVRFQVVASSASETAAKHLTPRELALANALLKARAVAVKHPASLVIGADTVVVLGTQVFGKPRSKAAAVKMLEALQGRTHQVVTGVCLTQLSERRQKLFSVKTSVSIRKLGRRQIRDYLTTINPLDKAGAYAIQEFGEWIIGDVNGSYSNVVGLPLERLEEELAAWTNKDQ